MEFDPVYTTWTGGGSQPPAELIARKRRERRPSVARLTGPSIVVEKQGENSLPRRPPQLHGVEVLWQSGELMLPDNTVARQHARRPVAGEWGRPDLSDARVRRRHLHQGRRLRVERRPPGPARTHLPGAGCVGCVGDASRRQVLSSRQELFELFTQDYCQGNASCQLGIVYAMDPSIVDLGAAQSISGEDFVAGSAMHDRCLKHAHTNMTRGL
jgi:hypothetical protein